MNAAAFRGYFQAYPRQLKQQPLPYYGHVSEAKHRLSGHGRGVLQEAFNPCGKPVGQWNNKCEETNWERQLSDDLPFQAEETC